jgi:NAD+ kinase
VRAKKSGVVHAHPFSPIVLLGRIEQERVREAMTALAAHLRARGITVLAEPGAAGALGDGVEPISDSELPKRARLVVAIGGDGTMLRATRLIAGHDVPLLGVNRGRLGFLTDVGAADMLERVDEVLAGRYVTEARMMLRAELARTEDSPLTGTALNDVVVQKFEIGRMIEFETWVDGVYLNTHRADGLIVATPTGSTAYALSCGGPILAPELDALALVPVCPHTLSDRPLVIRAGRQVELRLLERAATRAQVTVDGVLLGEFLPGDRLAVSAAPLRVTLLHPSGHDFYHVLRSKLHWGSERGQPSRDD